MYCAKLTRFSLIDRMYSMLDYEGHFDMLTGHCWHILRDIFITINAFTAYISFMVLIILVLAGALLIPVYKILWLDYFLAFLLLFLISVPLELKYGNYIESD